MRCPKCHYLSFDPEPRCKNCGYDLEVDDADLAMRAAEPADETMPDLTLRGRPAAPAEAHVTLTIRPTDTEPESASEPQWEPEPEPEWDPVVEPIVAAPPRLLVVESKPAARPDRLQTRSSTALVDPPARMFPPPVEPAARTAEPPMMRTPFRAPNTTAELPLFVKGIAESEALQDDVDLRSRLEPVLPPARPPLAVRRAAPEPPRARSHQPGRRVGPLDHDLLEDLQRVEREEAMARAVTAPADALAPEDRVEPAHRAAAAAIDTGVLGGIALFVFWATLRLCNISLSGLGVGALVPLLFFLALMDIGYLVMFTAAGGQTIGKMLMGIRVESADEAGGLSLGRAAFRSLLTFVSVIGLGLGWLPVLLGHGTLHDRLARTRVVRA
jgi:uncharacterized RDD family membrane protein YckC